MEVDKLNNLEDSARNNKRRTNSIISNKSVLKDSLRREALRELRVDEIEQMKDKLENLSPERIVEDILKNSKKNVMNSYLSEKKDIFLENLKTSSITSFIENIKNKSIKEIKSEYEKRLNEYNTATNLYSEKKNKENLEYVSQLELNKMRIQELENTITQLNHENKTSKEQLKQRESIISKLQSKFEIFDRLKPIFEEFFKEYPEENPVKIIQDIKEKREESIRIIEELNILKEKIFEMEIEKKEIMDKNKKQIQDLSNKLSQLESNNKDKVESYLNEINLLKSELSSYLNYKDENIKLHKMLFHIYNKLIERLSLDRNINLDPSLKVIEKDFKPDLFDNEEIAQYIKTMLVNSHEEQSAKMLRETIAYGNMMMRAYLRDNLNRRFDPVTIFKDIKDLLEKMKSKKKECKKQNNFLKEKINKYEADFKKMHSEIKYKQLQYENLEKKFNEFFSDRILRSKEMRNQMIMKRTTGGDHKSRIVDNNDTYSNNTNSKLREFNTDSTYTTNKKKKKRNGLNRRSTSAHPIKDILERKMENKKNKSHNKELFITENEKIENISINEENSLSKSKSKNKIKGSKSSARSRDIKSANTRPATTRTLYIRPQSSVTLFNYKKQQGKATKNSQKVSDEIAKITQSSHEVTEDLRIDSSKFKNLEFSKNKDKLERAGGYHVLPSYSDGFKSLVEHTNKLFLYKTRMKPDSENKNIFKRFQKNMDSNFGKLDKIIKKRDGVDYELGDRILNNINGMIKKLEKNQD